MLLMGRSLLSTELGPVTVDMYLDSLLRMLYSLGASCGRMAMQQCKPVSPRTNILLFVEQDQRRTIHSGNTQTSGQTRVASTQPGTCSYTVAVVPG